MTRRTANPTPSRASLPAVVTPDEPRKRAIRRSMAARAVRLGVTRNLRHGIYSEVAVREDVLDEAALLYARAPWLDPLRDGLLVEATARLVVRLRKLDALLDEEPSVVLTTLYARLEPLLTRNLEALGMAPRAAAALGLAHLDAKERAQRMTTETLKRYEEGAA